MPIATHAHDDAKLPDDSIDALKCFCPSRVPLKMPLNNLSPTIALRPVFTVPGGAMEEGVNDNGDSVKPSGGPEHVLPDLGLAPDANGSPWPEGRGVCGGHDGPDGHRG